MLLLALTLLAAQPQAQPQAEASPEIDCIIDSMTLAQRATLAEVVAGRATDGDASRRLVMSRADACAVRFGWTEAQKRAFGSLAAATMIGEHMERRLRAAGIDPQRIAAWLERQPLAVRTNNAPDDAVSDALLADLLRGGVPQAALDANGHDIGVYLGVLILIVRIGEGLPA